MLFRSIQFVLAIYILERTGSATIFAETLSVIIFPRLFLTPVAGVIGDRYSRIRLMQLFTALGALALLIFYRLSLNGLKLFEIFFLVITLELIEVFYQAPESALVPELVPASLLNEAVFVSKIDDGLVMVLSPAIGSLCYKAFGLSGGLLGAFFLEVLSLCLLFPIHPPFTTPREAASPMAESFQSGLKVFKDNRFLRTLTILAPVENFFFSALFPFFFRSEEPHV